MAQKKAAAKKTGVNKVAVGLGIGAAVAAGIAGAYFLYGKDGAKNRKKIKSWMIKAKGEALEKIEKLKDVSEENYLAAITAVGEKYSKVKDATPEEVAELMNDLKKQWKHMKAGLAPKKKAAKKAAKK